MGSLDGLGCACRSKNLELELFAEVLWALQRESRMAGVLFASKRSQWESLILDCARVANETAPVW